MKAKLSVVLLCVVLICGGCKSGESTKAAGSLATTPGTDNKMMIIARLSVKPERVKDFVAAAKEIIEKSNQESGCTFYQLYQDPYDASKFVFVEEYKNQAAVDSHFATEHFKAFGPKIADLVAGPAEIKIVSVAKEVLK
ncbi:MAG: putative quinol monooxygenase [Bacteroidia bacterium]|nr:putative quinol monooxygenase [Bacteroidia bacterium]